MPFIILLQSVFVPLLLSTVLLYLSSRIQRPHNLFIVVSWIIIFSWIKGEFILIPVEALDWIWVLVIVITLFSFITPKKKHTIISSIIFSLFLILFSWPVLKQSMSIALLLEIASFSILSALTFYGIQKHSAERPALIIAISSFSLAVTVGLGGSIFIAQLAFALVSLTGAFLYFELVGQAMAKHLSPAKQVMFLAIYFSLLFIARTYVDLPIVSTILLASSPSISLFYSARYYCLSSVVAGGIAILWVFLTTTQAGY